LRVTSRGLGDVYKRQIKHRAITATMRKMTVKFLMPQAQPYRKTC
jgi:hypothetical protein